MLFSVGQLRTCLSKKGGTGKNKQTDKQTKSSVPVGLERQDQVSSPCVKRNLLVFESTQMSLDAPAPSPFPARCISGLEESHTSFAGRIYISSACWMQARSRQQNLLKLLLFLKKKKKIFSLYCRKFSHQHAKL